ncbi:MAG: NAD(P)H-hydrate dehydratase [Candidatus Omnitrophica bacterium]|nr:NAD(P)H-hydrate dehydratase [Candidatus Omnitrophota bacterium]
MYRKHMDKMRSRREDSNKGDYGRVFVVAGSTGMTGAAYLASQAALRSGSGLVVNGVPDLLNPIMEIKLTEVITLPLPEGKKKLGCLGIRALKPVLEYSNKCDVVALGPGLGSFSETQRLARELTKRIEKPLVLDADGLNAIGDKLAYLRKRKYPTVITPHPGEMSRLIKKDIAFIQANREQAAKDLAKDTGAVVCLKGSRTVVASNDGQFYVNETGNSGMATGGTGDVLTGMIASFIGQGLDPFGATVTAVYIHGLAGDIAAQKKGPFSMIASDLLEYFPQAFEKAGLY